ncbi:MAG: LysR family transcriptional regulator [Hahellaceae bacterium]|jgi:DNA-binding transcriptional LysR family regulator|nr:LysR family transcriptional regulator [Hahellaceae bacterium]
MDLRGLRYFVSAVETGSITAAAERCHVAQPSITQAIGKLEDELDTRLLSRGRRGVEATPDGHALYRRAVVLLGQSAAIVDHFRHRKNRPALRCRQDVVLPTQRMQALLMRLAPLMQTNQMHFSRTFEQPDLTLCRPESAPVGHTFIPLWQDEYCLLLPIGHSLTYEPSLSIQDLNRLPMIERTFCEMLPMWEQFRASHNLKPDIVASCDEEDLALLLVETGVGAALAPFAEDLHSGRQLVSIPLSRIRGAPPVARQIGVALAPEFRGRASVVDLLKD